MTNNKRAVVLVFGLFCGTPAFAQQAPPAEPDTRAADPLFQSHDTLAVTITVPVERLEKERPLEEQYPGTLSYVDEAGETVSIDLQIRTRGRFRRQERICPFPPTRLNFKKKQTKDTLFDRQDKLKLVGHCRGINRFEQIVLREYLTYRMLNELTDLSFRVRLLRINWVDVDDPDDELVHYGFVIEHRDRLAKRIGHEPLRIPKTSVAGLEPEHTNVISVFQFFIANTDFSPILGAADDTCCHNANLFGEQDELHYSIPYDFDWAGLVDAPYAVPDERFGIRTVRQRVYRGRCVNNEHLPQTLQTFRDNKDVFFALVENQADLSGGSRRSMLALMNDFYELIDDERAVQRRIIDACLGPG